MKKALHHVFECDLNLPCQCELKNGDFFVYPNDNVHQISYENDQCAIPCSILIFYLGPAPSLDHLNGSPMNTVEALDFLEKHQHAIRNYFYYHQKAIILMDFYHTGKLNLKISCKPTSKVVRRICLILRSIFGIKTKPVKVEPKQYRPIEKIYQKEFSLLTDTVPPGYNYSK
uniref:JmjC domain-containing protein n=1 Tax=Caenorhabditis tropicalis TaxID=1561998 RepID=A0A1I7TNE4_9PELO